MGFWDAVQLSIDCQITAQGRQGSRIALAAQNGANNGLSGHPRWVDCTTVTNGAPPEDGKPWVMQAESIGHRGEAKAAISGLAAHRRSNQRQTHVS